MGLFLRPIELDNAVMAARWSDALSAQIIEGGRMDTSTNCERSGDDVRVLYPGEMLHSFREGKRLPLPSGESAVTGCDAHLPA